MGSILLRQHRLTRSRLAQHGVGRKAGPASKLPPMKQTVLVILWSSLLLAQGLAGEMPVSAEIVDVPSERRDSGHSIGNIRVRFSDGRSENWTRLGRCLHVRRSSTGLVGWSRFRGRNSYGEPVNSVLRVMVTTTKWKDFKVGSFIEDWNFADRDSTVIVKSRGRHGPSQIHKFSLKTGKLIAQAKGSERYVDTPEWAKPLADDQPR